MQFAQDACAQHRSLDRIGQRLQQTQQHGLDIGFHPAGYETLRLGGRRPGISPLDFRGDLGGQRHVELHIDRKQRPFRAGDGFHPERNGHRHCQIMLLVVEMHCAFKHALLAPLQHEDGPRLVEHRNVMKDRLRPENANAGKPRLIVSLIGGEMSGQFHQRLARRPPALHIHRIWQDFHRF